MRRAVATTLERYRPGSFELYHADDGAEGMRLVGSAAPDLIFCDFNMPNMDGMAFLEKLRQRHGHAKTPLIMMSAETRPEFREAAANAGARWLPKPFTPTLLRELTDRCLQQTNSASD